ncbi:type 1 glutamine amidotransferase domain-containing protein [Rathayibacter sp. YIM 133350]|uniref:type 1 glutamine amidotransferase domain-containing protein n=1 Tax=Rathayibacter sp. YIM 133350 TaxID=3131992 RepID=UPI00307DE62E
MANELDGKRVAFLMTDGVEQVEFTAPWQAVTDAGASATLVSLQEGEVQGFNHVDKGDTFPVDAVVGTLAANDFDALVLPGGVVNGDALRIEEKAQQFVRGFFEEHKPVGVICHGGWILIDAGVASGRTLTSWPTLQSDLRNAGATWVDKEVHVDNGLVSSRKPDDLPAFTTKLVEEIAEGAHAGQTA